MLASGRRAASARMRRQSTARPVVGVGADPVTGGDVVEYGPPIYEGKCRIDDGGMTSSDHEAGGSSVVESRMEWHIPFDSPRIPVGTVIFFEGDVSEYRTTDVADGDDMTARRYPIEVVTS